MQILFLRPSKVIYPIVVEFLYRHLLKIVENNISTHFKWSSLNVLKLLDLKKIFKFMKNGLIWEVFLAT